MSSEYKYYSIVLKGCSNRTKLAGSLEKLLLRGRLAIKMALDNIPSVIIYKGNVDNIASIYNTFAAEYAAITILPDGVPPAIPLSKKYRDFITVPSDIQPLLTGVPDNLWLGEAIHRIIPANFLDETGAMVITSHAIYFIDKPAGDTECRWLILPYNQIISLKINETDSNLTINYQDAAGQQQDVFIILSEFLPSAQKSIEQAIAAKRYLTKIKTICTACDYTAEATLDKILPEEKCPTCSQSINHLIIT